MTNYNERLDGILDRVLSQESSREGGYAEYYADDIEYRESLPYGNQLANQGELKQALTSLFKELVAEAKPSKKHVGDEVAENRSYTGERLFNATIDEYHANLLKALEEV